ncbi:hypothetical protein L486_07927 [Kwoniella mangroviensis CBS 10435]|uniref:Uncharacterized protein n=1 Tax=Kwoniella mangroviensis CBS 10435 TaxID=1331196 RepID=A0A1B9IH98_9TREE|nr:uncharacterized protein I203_06805 [Kwoniella mangroviensis CBS 8507]OCF54791.1 hypothetical protein L486_07927 [Kwoniella mangroviensis CBS 10435]OCF64221.1 hypothetical protein I203_06805 [Kwoniella mangroviensis CBS 8507]OCF78575.1 hypothetical protein I204_00515 [Kwoniella mangroviensis CBS 8886]
MSEAEQLHAIEENYPSDSEGAFSDEETFQTIKELGLPSDDKLSSMETPLISKGDLSELLDPSKARGKRSKRFVVNMYRTEGLIPESEESRASEMKATARPGMHERTTSTQSNLSVASQEDYDKTTAELDDYTRRGKQVNDLITRFHACCDESMRSIEETKGTIDRLARHFQSSHTK